MVPSGIVLSLMCRSCVLWILELCCDECYIVYAARVGDVHPALAVNVTLRKVPNCTGRLTSSSLRTSACVQNYCCDVTCVYNYIVMVSNRRSAYPASACHMTGHKGTQGANECLHCAEHTTVVRQCDQVAPYLPSSTTPASSRDCKHIQPLQLLGLLSCGASCCCASCHPGTPASPAHRMAHAGRLWQSG